MGAGWEVVVMGALGWEGEVMVVYGNSNYIITSAYYKQKSHMIQSKEDEYNERKKSGKAYLPQ